MARISGFDVHTAVAPLGGLGERAWRPVNRRRNACLLPLRQPSGFEVRTGDLRRVVAFTPVNTGYFACSPPFPHSGFDLHGIPVLFSPRHKTTRDNSFRVRRPPGRRPSKKRAVESSAGRCDFAVAPQRMERGRGAGRKNLQECLECRFADSNGWKGGRTQH